MVMGVAQEIPPVIQSNILQPQTLDLRHVDASALLVSDSRDAAWNVAARQNWEPIVTPMLAAGSVRVVLPDGASRVPLLLAASQALKARNSTVSVFIAFQPDSAPLLDEAAWGAVDGGVLLPGDLGEDPERWSDVLAAAQRQFPGRTWTLWLGRDPMEKAAQLLGDGGRLVVPDAGPTGLLVKSLPKEAVDVEGGLGNLTLRLRSGGQALRWVFKNGQWLSISLPRESRNEVAVQDHEAYDVGALLARMRATRLRDEMAVKNLRAQADVALHFQGEGESSDLAFRFESFERAGEPDEMVRKEIRFNGVRANLAGSAQLPIVEARSSMAAPAALTLTERYRYWDGGPAGAGRRRIHFAPVDSDPTLCEGELTVDEGTGRILEERSRRSGLPGVVRSEQRVISYGELLPGFWRVTRIHTAERWLGAEGVDQVMRDITYDRAIINDPGFDAAREAAMRGDESILRNTGEGYRYLVKQGDGTRKVETRMTSGGRAVGGMVLIIAFR